MCTLTWTFEAGGNGYTLLFNRDELRTRKKAQPPTVKQTPNGVTYLAPTDTDAGGTWLAVNQYGLTFCLLNYYAAKTNLSDNIHSRGEVIVKLADCASIAECESRLQLMDLSVYQGFELVVIHKSVRHWCWNTNMLLQTEARLPVTSSSYETNAVQRERERYFTNHINADSVDSLMDFHRCHISGDGELIQSDIERSDIINSVCVHREASTTVSQCIVKVSDYEASIDYLDGSPCEAERVSHSSLIRRQVA